MGRERITDQMRREYLLDRLQREELHKKWRLEYISCILCQLSDDLDDFGLCEECQQEIVEFAKRETNPERV